MKLGQCLQSLKMQGELDVGSRLLAGAVSYLSSAPPAGCKECCSYQYSAAGFLAKVITAKDSGDVSL